MDEEIKRLQELLNTTEEGTLGYTLISIEIAERESLEKSLKRLI